MKKKNLLLALVTSCLLVAIGNAQPKHEFRAAWIATVSNIDWPSSNKLSSDEQKSELIRLLNQMQAAGINAVIFQVRPCADAFYNSSFEGWSRYLSGTEGVPPYPFFDPLKFIIDECHQRGMELHAWFNPYRSLTDARKNTHPSNHVSYTHPEWFFKYGGKQYFNPGVPAARDYVHKVIMEVVRNYDIDAVHLDDYFYPYKIGKLPFPDYNTFLQYGSSYESIDDWRRQNVNDFVQLLHTQIAKQKPTVKFGISPFGVWRNIANDPDGSLTTAGVQNYDDLYADVLLWQRNGWIDYLLPQLYWERGHRAADYTTLVQWWNNHAYNRGMYIGLGMYQLGVGKASCWRSGAEIIEQINDLRAQKKCNGYALYSANGFLKNKYGIVQSLQYNTNATKAIVPAMPWLDASAPATPKAILKKVNGKTILTMQHSSADDNAFVIYTFAPSEKIDIAIAKNIFTIQGASTLQLDEWSATKKIVVTSLDRARNESDYTIAK